jgi:TolB protein
MMKSNSIMRLGLTLALVGGVAYASAAQQNDEPDTGAKRQVTTESTYEHMAAWSKDGSSLYFVSDRFGSFGICRVSRTGGGGIASVTQPSDDEIDVFPDVNKVTGDVAFGSNRGRGIFQIWSVSPGSRGLTQLTNTSYGANYPAWSPDGKEIAYTALDKNGSEFIWIMDVNGSEARQLAQGTQPRWSPDGRHLVYSTITQSKKNKSRDIYTIEIATNTISQITSEETAEFSPDWSPDGRWIVYVAYKGKIKFLKNGKEAVKDLKSKPNYEIWLKNVEDSGRSGIQLTRTKGLNDVPRWAPGSRELAFVSTRGGSHDIWLMAPGVVAAAPASAP